eukprot:m51a1_g6345 putative glycoside hydrolase family 7 protein (1712) ;mRNA; r:52690-69936
MAQEDPLASVPEHIKAVLALQGVHIEYSPELASRDFKAGELAMSCAPYALCVHTHLRESHCNHCFRRCESLRRCSGCKRSWYCGAECQAAAWRSGHRRECASWKAHSDLGDVSGLPDTVQDSIDVACRVLWRRDAELQAGRAAANEASYEDVESLVSHHAEVCRTDERRKAGNAQIARLVLARYNAGGKSAPVSFDEACELVCRMQCNNFSVWDGLIFSLGAGVFPAGAYVNHSCDATTVVTYNASNGMAQEFRCSRDVKAGEELTHCYLDLASTSASRSKDLLEQYLFRCSCAVCQSSGPLDSMLCGVSPSAPPRELELASRMFEEGCDLRRPPEMCAKMLAKAFEIRSKHMNEMNLELMSTAAHLMTSYMEESNWAQAAKMARHVLRVYRAVYPKVHPMLGLHLYTLGDLLLEMGENARADADAAHLEALTILRITHGRHAEICAQQCALDGCDYQGTYGVTSSGSALTLKFVTHGPYSTNIGSRLFLMASDDKYRMFKLINREFAFDVDVSQLPCGLNGALYFAEMAENGGMGLGNNNAGAKYGTGYCDAQCPHDIKFIGGAANVIDWKPSSSDVNAGTGKWGSCCGEMDIWEANKMAAAYTPHNCNFRGQKRCEDPRTCGDTASGNRFNGVCDKDGCDFNSYRMGDKNFFGEGKTVDTTRPFTVVTQFVTSDNTDNGNLVEIRRFYKQNGRVIPNSRSTLTGLTSFNSISDKFCAAQKSLFGDTNDFAAKGGMRAQGEMLRRGMVLVLSLWDDHDVNMLWLDSNMPANADPSRPGVARGSCSTSSGKPTDVEAQFPNAQVVFSNIKFGPIGSTTPGVPKPPSKKQNKFYNSEYKGHVFKIQVVVNNQGIPMDVQGLHEGTKEPEKQHTHEHVIWVQYQGARAVKVGGVKEGCDGDDLAKYIQEQRTLSLHQYAAADLFLDLPTGAVPQLKDYLADADTRALNPKKKLDPEFFGLLGDETIELVPASELEAMPHLVSRDVALGHCLALFNARLHMEGAAERDRQDKQLALYATPGTGKTRFLEELAVLDSRRVSYYLECAHKHLSDKEIETLHNSAFTEGVDALKDVVSKWVAIAVTYNSKTRFISAVDAIPQRGLALRMLEASAEHRLGVLLLVDEITRAGSKGNAEVIAQSVGLMQTTFIGQEEKDGCHMPVLFTAISTLDKVVFGDYSPSGSKQIVYIQLPSLGKPASAANADVQKAVRASETYRELFYNLGKWPRGALYCTEVVTKCRDGMRPITELENLFLDKLQNLPYLEEPANFVVLATHALCAHALQRNACVPGLPKGKRTLADIMGISFDGIELAENQKSGLGEPLDTYVPYFTPLRLLRYVKYKNLVPFVAQQRKKDIVSYLREEIIIGLRGGKSRERFLDGHDFERLLAMRLALCPSLRHEHSQRRVVVSFGNKHFATFLKELHSHTKKSHKAEHEEDHMDEDSQGEPKEECTQKSMAELLNDVVLYPEPTSNNPGATDKSGKPLRVAVAVESRCSKVAEGPDKSPIAEGPAAEGPAKSLIAEDAPVAEGPAKSPNAEAPVAGPAESLIAEALASSFEGPAKSPEPGEKRPTIDLEADVLAKNTQARIQVGLALQPKRRRPASGTKEKLEKKKKKARSVRPMQKEAAEREGDSDQEPDAKITEKLPEWAINMNGIDRFLLVVMTNQAQQQQLEKEENEQHDDSEAEPDRKTEKHQEDEENKEDEDVDVEDEWPAPPC